MGGDAGIVGFLARVFLAGQIMAWPGMFKPGVTPNVTILNYWPGFVIGGAVCGFLASEGARLVLAAMAED